MMTWPGRVTASVEECAQPPRSAESRQQVAIEAVVTGHLPGQHDADGEGEQDRVRRGRAGEQVGHVHQCAEEGRDAGQGAEDEGQANGDLAEGDEQREPALGMVADQQIQEVAIPVVGDRTAGRVRRGLPLRRSNSRAVPSRRPPSRSRRACGCRRPARRSRGRCGSAARTQPAARLLNRKRAKGGPSTSTSSEPGALRKFMYSATSRAMNETQKIQVTIVRRSPVRPTAPITEQGQTDRAAAPST